MAITINPLNAELFVEFHELASNTWALIGQQHKMYNYLRQSNGNA